MGKKQNNTKDSLGNRMKSYENVYRTDLPENFPLIIRLDGSHFHTYTKGLVKPFDDKLIDAFWETSKFLAENISGVKYVYHQSDEISLLIRNDDNYYTQAWFNNNLQKLISISASLATAKFNEVMKKHYPEKSFATFDSRVFILPESEINNYFYWRESDAMRNSVSMVAQSMFSHKSLQGKNRDEMISMLLDEKGFDYHTDLELYKQRGASLEKEYFEKDGTNRSHWVVNKEMPILSQDKSVLAKYRK